MKGFWKKAIYGTALALGVLWLSTPRADAGFTNVGVIDEGGGEFWDNFSNDGKQKNVGFFLTKTGYFATKENANSPAISAANLQFLTDPSWKLGAGADGEATIDLLIEIAGNKATNELWILDSNGFQKVFEGSDAPTDSKLVTVEGQYTLILVDTAGNNIFYSTGSHRKYTNDADPFGTLTGLSSSKQNFALFQDSSLLNSPFWVGIEDLFGGDTIGGINAGRSNKGDYNDMIIKITSDDGNFVFAVPAPPAAMLAIAGILPCIALRRRLRAHAG
jgi:hypothetical protein